MSFSEKTKDNRRIILFDGWCNLCNSTVNIILRVDRKAKFSFASLQSEAGIRLKTLYNLEPYDNHSVILIENGKVFRQSTAVLHVLNILGGGWKIFYGLIVIPAPIRDYFYLIIARYRYKWFGKRKTCRVPTGDEVERFIQ
jgi:predicted DCC family thiol-disulfide oxidoreductase YuxK